VTLLGVEPDHLAAHTFRLAAGRATRRDSRSPPARPASSAS
jgi:hypothetical protein